MPFEMLFRAARQLPHGRHLPQDFLPALAQMRVHAAGKRARELARERADVLRNRHVVVVQDDQQVGRQRAGVIQGLEGHARGHRSVADHGDDAPIIAEPLGADGHAEGGADRGARVPDTERVVLAFRARRKGCQAARLLDGVELLAPARQHLVRIGLMSHVPHDPITGRVKDVVQRDRQLHGSQASGEVTPTGTHALDQKFPQLLGQGRKFRRRQLAQVGRALDGIQQRVLAILASHLAECTPARDAARNPDALGKSHRPAQVTRLTTK